MKFTKIQLKKHNNPLIKIEGKIARIRKFNENIIQSLCV